jgi:hypothetical protein
LIGIGVVAGFWHILWVAGVAILLTGLLGVAVHSGGLPPLRRLIAAYEPEYRALLAVERARREAAQQEVVRRA